MEISASTPATSPQPVRETVQPGKLATLRALQRALEAEQRVVEDTPSQQDGKGQLLDIRC